MKPQRHRFAPSRYRVTAAFGNKIAVWSTRTGSIVELDKEDAGHFEDGTLDKISGRVIENLLEARLLVDGEIDERDLVNAENRQAAGNDSVLDIVILPSSDCALGCNLGQFGAYCGQKHEKGRIQPKSISDIAQLADRSVRPCHTRLNVNWFGGEPLLAFDQMRQVTASLKGVAARHGLDYDAALVTGGQMFTLDIARECHVSLNIRSVSITLDGLPDVHDKRRCTKAGRPTFERIMGNIRAVAGDLDLNTLALSIRCNIDRRNVESFDRLIDYFVEQGIQDRIEFYPANVHPWGAMNNRDLFLAPDEFAAREIVWLRKLIATGFTSPRLPKRKPIVCRVVSSSHIVVGHDGEVHRCTETPLTPVNLPKDSLGNAGLWQSIDQVPRWDWHDQVENRRFPCAECVYLPVCGGACPLSWTTGSDVPCPPFRFNGSERLAVFMKSVQAARSGEDPGTDLTIKSFSIPEILQLSSPDETVKRDVAAFLRTLETIRKTTPPDSYESCAEDLELGSIKVPSLTDPYLKKLAQSCNLATASYLHYLDGNLARLTDLTEANLRLLSAAQRLEPKRDLRLAQVQTILNLLGGQLKGFGRIDQALAQSLEAYLMGSGSLRLPFVILPRIQPGRYPEAVLSGALASVQEILSHAQRPACQH
ncbi:radical SAM protein [Roseibium marinum]|uniref:radical SAM protein n=1 Tax=Roseibium marinum TaxID=281252 RepID=UPI00147642BA|nr:radical SAM protein [Roseibium marinum]